MGKPCPLSFRPICRRFQPGCEKDDPPLSPRRSSPGAADAEVVTLTETDALHTLKSGKMAEQGLLPYSSNHSFLVTVAGGI